MEEQALVPVDQGVIYGGEKINFSCWLTWKPICQLTPQPLAGICGSVFWPRLWLSGPVFQLNLCSSRRRQPRLTEQSLIYDLETKANRKHFAIIKRTIFMAVPGIAFVILSI